jgi:uncharacterized membrane protein YhaH (DUF805 family)
MMSMTAVLLQNNMSSVFGALFGSVWMLFWFALVVVAIVGAWKTLEKAGQPGWAILVPFYNAYVLLKVAGRPGWWLLLFLIPLVNIAIAIIVAIDVAKAFGQSAAFGFFLLFLLCGVGYLILGFGNYRYQGRAASAVA